MMYTLWLPKEYSINKDYRYDAFLKVNKATCHILDQLRDYFKNIVLLILLISSKVRKFWISKCQQCYNQNM